MSETHFRTSVVVRLGPLRVPIEGTVEIVDSNPPDAYSLRGHGGARVIGAATGLTRIRLTEVGGGCRLDYVVEAEAEGPLAALGTIALTAVAKHLTDRFTQALALTLQTYRREEDGGSRGT